MTAKKLETGTFTDERDGKEYRTVEMPGGKVWMAQNLNYEIKNSWCYPNDEYIGKTYGRLYTWDAAMKACPTGWRLPSKFDWMNLGIALGYTWGGVLGFPSKKLMAESDWFVSKTDDCGTDDYGFSALPVGSCDENGNSLGFGHSCVWWLCTMSSGEKCADTCYMTCDCFNISIFIGTEQKLSVRCVQ
jgi:uncharacterized protein (TIGR02145 family)